MNFLIKYFQKLFFKDVKYFNQSNLRDLTDEFVDYDYYTICPSCGEKFINGCKCNLKKQAGRAREIKEYSSCIKYGETSGWCYCPENIIEQYNKGEKIMKRYEDNRVFVNPDYFKEVIKSILKHNKVHFKFEKKDGTIRDAYGTCNVIEATTVNENAKPKGTGANEADSIIKYYDLEKAAWRSFRFEKLREIDEIEPIESVYVHSATQRINEINARLLEITKERKKLDNERRKAFNNLEWEEFEVVMNKVDNTRDQLNEEALKLRLELKDLKQ